MKTQKTPIKILTTDALMTALLILTGMIKLPSFVPGAEFQLSAPFAIYIVTLLGFKRYLGIGVCASCIQLMLGTHTILNVIIAMAFRIIAGTIVTVFPNRKIGMLIAGPLGTTGARIILAQIIHIPVASVIGAAVPGMLFTVVCVYLFLPVLKRLENTTFLQKE